MKQRERIYPHRSKEEICATQTYKLPGQLQPDVQIQSHRGHDSFHPYLCSIPRPIRDLLAGKPPSISSHRRENPTVNGQFVMTKELNNNQTI